ncbi:MAG: uncharacterized protein H6R26_2526 [Proteobacteria bacterium]|nr:uncharacterized protein [Pseudomonadota bacterium]
MPPLFRYTCIALLSAGLAALLLSFLTLDTQPTVAHNQTGSQSYLAATRNLLHKAARRDPLQPQEPRSIALTATDLTAVANFALLRKHLDGHAAAAIHGKRLDFAASIKIPGVPVDLYLNLKLVADDAAPKAVIRRLKVGRISLPEPLVGLLQFATFRLTPLRRYTHIIAPLVREVRITDQRLRMVVNWNRDTLARTQEQVADASSRERLLAYHEKLSEYLNEHAHKRYIGLGRLMQPMFALAESRSNDPDIDAAEENRALILVLGAYANGRDLMTELKGSGGASALPQKNLLLNRRIDTAQHFMGSAALAISGHKTLADVIGLAKEINDTHSGSGFSFIDLAADRAGALFGKTVTQSQTHARKAQRILSEGSDESVFMPDIRDLPEELGPDEFAQRFGNVGSPEFEKLKRDIEDRIEACPLYR